MMMDVIAEALLSPLEYSFMVRALIVSVTVGIMCPAVGAYVVTRGLGFMGDALAHAILPGMALAFMLGLSPFVGIIPTAVGVALLIGYMTMRARVSEDTSIGIMFAGMFALGLVMLTMAGGLPVNLEDVLLGQVLGTSSGDVRITLALAGGVLIVLWAAHKEFVFANFDPTGASVLGLPTRLLDYGLLVLLALVISISLQAVGVVLVISMLITPAATAQLLVRNFTWSVPAGMGFGAASAIIGLYLSFHYNLPSGPAMALVAAGFFMLAAAYTWLLSGMARRSRASASA